MKILPTGIDGAKLIKTDRFSDERGFFFESYRYTRYADLGITDQFVQDNLSRSKRGVLRGLHYQMKHPQAQLLTVVRGKIFDVVVDLRRNSETFGQWFGAELGDDGICQIYMAPGLAHGFCVLSELADLHYQVSREYDPSDEGGVLWSDPKLAISWPIKDPIISSRDARFSELEMIADDLFPFVNQLLPG